MLIKHYSNFFKFVSLDGFTRYATNQCGGAIADIAESMIEQSDETEVPAFLMEEAALLIIDSARRAAGGQKITSKAKSAAAVAVEKSKSRLVEPTVNKSKMCT